MEGDQQNRGVSPERKKELTKKWKDAAKQFGKIASKAHGIVPKEEQLTLDARYKAFLKNKYEVDLLIQKPNDSYIQETGSSTVNDAKKSQVGDVRMFNDDERLACTRIIRANDNRITRLYNQDGTVYDTSEEVSKYVTGRVAFVIDLDGNLITHSHVANGKQNVFHSSLLTSKPVLCAGMLEVKDGEITYISEDSGHYKPTSSHLYNGIKNLKMHGDVFSADATATTCKQKINDFIASMEVKGEDGLTIPERTFKNIKQVMEILDTRIDLAVYEAYLLSDPAKIDLAAHEAYSLSNTSDKENSSEGCLSNLVKKFSGIKDDDELTITEDERKSLVIKFPNENDLKLFGDHLRIGGYKGKAYIYPKQGECSATISKEDKHLFLESLHLQETCKGLPDNCNKTDDYSAKKHDGANKGSSFWRKPGISR